MKTAQQIYMDQMWADENDDLSLDEIAIKVAKIYAKQAIERAAEKATALTNQDGSPFVNKQSILSVIEEMK